MTTSASNLRLLRNVLIRTNRNFCTYARLAQTARVRNKLQLLHQSTHGLQKFNNRRFMGNQEQQPELLLDQATYERICGETLDALADYFEILTEKATHIQGTDVSYGDGVLTINLGVEHGIYVINRQTPNRQIWLSSPTSGPKRYDFVSSTQNGATGQWIYKHNNETLHTLLQREMQNIFGVDIDFLHLPFAN